MKDTTVSKMNHKYSTLLKSLKKLYIKKKVSALDIVSELPYNNKGNLSVFDDTYVKILKDKPLCEALDDLFYEIKKQWKFFDCDVIESIIEGNPFDEAERLLKNYHDEIKKILEYDLNERYSITEENFCKYEEINHVLRIKCDLEKVFVEQWKSIKQALNKCFNFPRGTLQFDCTVSGCITLICKISLPARKYLLQLKFTKHQLKPLADLKILSLIIDGKELKVPLEHNTKVTT